MATVYRDMNHQLKTCPYNSAHKVKASRFQMHVTNCAKQYVLSKHRVCLFNATHHIPEDQYEEHLIICPDNKLSMQSTLKKEKNEPKTEDEPLIEDKDIWIEQYLEETTAKNYDILDGGDLTAEELFKRRFNSGEDAFFTDTIYLQKMSYEERRKYQQMCVQRIKEINSRDSVEVIEDSHEIQVLAQKQKSGEKQTNESVEETPVAVPPQPRVELRPPNVRPFGKQRATGLNSESGSDDEPIGKYRGVGIGRGIMKTRGVSYHK